SNPPPTVDLTDNSKKRYKPKLARAPADRASQTRSHNGGAGTMGALRYTLPPWQVLDEIPGESRHTGPRRAIWPYGCLSHLACTGSGTPPVACSIWGAPSACAAA